MAKGVCKCMTKGVVCECVAKKPRQKRNKKPPRQKASKLVNPVLNAVPFHSIPQSFNKESNQGLSEILTNILKQQKQKESSHISTQTISTNNMATEVPDFDSLDLLTPLNQSSVFLPIPKPQEIIYKPKSPKPIAVSNNDINTPSSSKFFASPQFHFKNNTPSISPPAPPPPSALFDTAHQTEIVHAEQPPMKGYKPAQPKLISPPSAAFGSSQQTEIFHAEQPPQVVMKPLIFGNQTPTKPIKSQEISTDEKYVSSMLNTNQLLQINLKTIAGDKEIKPKTLTFHEEKILAPQQMTTTTAPIKIKAAGNPMHNVLHFGGDEMGKPDEYSATRLDKFRKQYDSSNRIGKTRGKYTTTLNFVPENVETTRGMVERGSFTQANIDR